MNDYDEPTMDDLYDAIIEDTTHCQCCNASFVLGGNDYVIVESPQMGDRVAQIVLCVECAKAVHDEYRKLCKEMGEEP